MLLEPQGEEPVRIWAIQTLSDGAWTLRTVSGEMRAVLLPGRPEAVVVRGVGRTGLASEWAGTRPGAS